jgi:hypothetical protein
MEEITSSIVDTKSMEEIKTDNHARAHSTRTTNTIASPHKIHKLMNDGAPGRTTHMRYQLHHNIQSLSRHDEEIPNRVGPKK